CARPGGRRARVRGRRACARRRPAGARGTGPVSRGEGALAPQAPRATRTGRRAPGDGERQGAEARAARAARGDAPFVRTSRPRAGRRPLDVSRVLAARRRGGLVAIFDLDGTLAPIAPTPTAARVPAAVRRALGRLARRGDTVVGVASGRPLAEVVRL